VDHLAHIGVSIHLTAQLVRIEARLPTRIKTRHGDKIHFQAAAFGTIAVATRHGSSHVNHPARMKDFLTIVCRNVLLLLLAATTLSYSSSTTPTALARLEQYTRVGFICAYTYAIFE